MGTRGAFGVVIGEKEKIGYNQYDSYPDGKGIEALRWLREADLNLVRKQAKSLRVVDDKTKPTPEDVELLQPWTDLGVSNQSTDDWYCLTRQSHGYFNEMLQCGYVLDSHEFPIDSLFCEWAYILDLDRNVFEVYEGFQKKFPKKGRWAKRPTKAEDEANWIEHLKWCARQDPPRMPWEPERREYKAVELTASWPLDALPTDEEFLAQTRSTEEVEA